LIFVIEHPTFSSTNRWRLGIAAGALALGLTACGGGSAVTAAGDAPAEPVSSENVAPGELGAEAAAEANLPLLQPAEEVVDFEVLDVSDGSISTLRDEVSGDRPVLLWFFSPH